VIIVSSAKKVSVPYQKGLFGKVNF